MGSVVIGVIANELDRLFSGSWLLKPLVGSNPAPARPTQE